VFRKKSIDEWAFDYWLLQRYAKICFRIFYRKITVINRHNIPATHPVILAPNHQNALMDALVLVCNTEYQTVFLARADIFKGKFLTRVLTFMNIMPIYRIRDGYENVKRNDEVFEKTMRVMRNHNNPLCLFPEGNHGDHRRLRSLVKGLFRIALMAQQEFGDKPGIKIIPIGIDYGHYFHFRTTLFVNIGQPIEISSFYKTYTENPVQAINELRERYAAEVSKLMINIQTGDYYDTYMALRTICNDDLRKWLDITDHSPEGRFHADKAMIDMLDRELVSAPDQLQELDQVVTDYQLALKQLGLRDWVLRKEKYSLLRLLLDALLKLIALPVFIAGFINNFVPYRFTESKEKQIKDSQFRSSFKFVIGMIVFPIWYLVFGGLICFLPVPAWTKLVYILLLPATGLLAFHYYIGLKKLKSRFVYTLAVIRRDAEVMRMKNLRNKILQMMHELVNRQTKQHEN
jgi:1-acyl-sn-glycerol-3-phosphate acyltransferase